MNYCLIKPERKFVMIRLLRSFKRGCFGFRIPILKTVLYGHKFYDKKEYALWDLNHENHIHPESLRIIPVIIQQYFTGKGWIKVKGK